MDNTIALTSTKFLKEKVEINRYILKILSDEFFDYIIFTGGTSLMERNIINRFSEDIDIITSISRKIIKNKLEETEGLYISHTKDNQMVCTYTITVDDTKKKIETKLDVVNFKKCYINESDTFEDLQEIEPIIIQSKDNTVSIKVKKIEYILYDKLCVLIEDITVIEQVFKNKASNKKYRTIYAKENSTVLREIRQYYDITMLLRQLKLNEVLLEIEIKKRISSSNKFKCNVSNIDSLLKFVSNKELFMSSYSNLEEQLFKNSKDNPDYSEIYNSVTSAINIIIKILQNIK